MPRITMVSALALALAGCVRSSATAEPMLDEAALERAEAVETRQELAHGEALFVRRWRAGDPHAGGDGLGPLFNDVSCVACHSQGGPGGAGPASKNTELLVQMGTVGMLHKASIVDGRERKRDAVLGDRDFAPALHTPMGRRPMPSAVIERNTPALFGAGLIDAISPGDLLLIADRQRLEGTVSGRVGRSADGEIARFGWKGDVATLGDFVAQACANELGLSTDEQPQPTPPGARANRAVDLGREQLGALRAYVRALPAPSEVESEIEPLHPGESLFNAVGCGACHVENLGGAERLFSDLLLHDMGAPLTDGQVRAGAYGGLRAISPAVAREMATAQEWRTPPLWGVADSGPWLHDGRAKTLLHAIQLHDGEARAAKALYFRLDDAEQAQVLGFLQTLRAPKVGWPTAW